MPLVGTRCNRMGVRLWAGPLDGQLIAQLYRLLLLPSFGLTLALRDACPDS